MAEDRIIVRRAQASDIPALKQVLQETFEGTWLPHKAFHDGGVFIPPLFKQCESAFRPQT